MLSSVSIQTAERDTHTNDTVLSRLAGQPIWRDTSQASRRWADDNSSSDTHIGIEYSPETLRNGRSSVAYPCRPAVIMLGSATPLHGLTWQNVTYMSGMSFMPLETMPLNDLGRIAVTRCRYTHDS